MTDLNQNPLEATQTSENASPLIAKTVAGLENVLADELEALGATGVQVLNRAVSFNGGLEMIYRTNFCCRTALRILSPLFSFQLADEDDLYAQILHHPWEEVFDIHQTFAIDAVVSDSELTHSFYVALRTKDAIADRFREHFNGRRPSVDTDNPEIRINIHINGSTCDVSLDSSGASLHKRGYRVSNAEAPMSEVLAAGLILLSGWKGECNFIDPMCGSGTLLIEAALIANNFPAGMYRRDFCFMHWKNFDEKLWEKVKEEAFDAQREFEHLIIGLDISARNLGSARSNIKSAKLHKDIELHVSPFAAYTPPQAPGIIVTNPPYGERIRISDIDRLYSSIGDTLKQNYKGYNAWLISSDRMALKFVGLRPTVKHIIWNGPLECRFSGFELYEGTRKVKSDEEPDESITIKRHYKEELSEDRDEHEEDEPETSMEGWNPLEIIPMPKPTEDKWWLNDEMED